MKLSRQDQYAVRALLALALAEDGVAMPLPLLAGRTDIPASYLEQILHRLRLAGLVGSKRGMHGGYVLARAPEAITVAAATDALNRPRVDARDAPDASLESCPGHECLSAEACVAEGLWRDIRETVAGIVNQTTIGDLVQRVDEHNASAARA